MLNINTIEKLSYKLDNTKNNIIYDIQYIIYRIGSVEYQTHEGFKDNNNYLSLEYNGVKTKDNNIIPYDEFSIEELQLFMSVITDKLEKDQVRKE